MDDELQPLPRKELDAFARVFRELIADEDRYFATIREATFARYLKLYARYYEDARHHKPPLGIRDADAHAEHLGDSVRIRVCKAGIVVSFWYALDREHGLELRFKGRKLMKVGGFSDT